MWRILPATALNRAAPQAGQMDTRTRADFTSTRDRDALRLPLSRRVNMAALTHLLGAYFEIPERLPCWSGSTASRP